MNICQFVEMLSEWQPRTKVGHLKPSSRKAVTEPPASILAIDIGGSKLKILATGENRPRPAAVSGCSPQFMN
jgi:hypothetical protein